MLQPFQENFAPQFKAVFGDLKPQSEDNEPTPRGIMFHVNRVGRKFFDKVTYKDYVTSSDSEEDDDKRFGNNTISGPENTEVSHPPL